MYYTKSIVTFIWETKKYHFGLQSDIGENVGINYLYLYLDFYKKTLKCSLEEFLRVLMSRRKFNLISMCICTSVCTHIRGLVLTSENAVLEDWCDFDEHSTALF